MRFLEMFIDDCKYYDTKNAEIKAVLKYAKPKGKTLLDIGAGIGRLSFPLSKYAKKAIALDKDKRFKEYFNKHKKKNLVFVNQRAESYLTKGKKFDVIIWAWPEFSKFDFKVIDLIEKSMDKKSIFILITPANKSDFANSMNKLNFTKDYRPEKGKKRQFIWQISKRFIIAIKKKLFANYAYPNEKIAFRILKNDMKLFLNIKLNKKSEDKLREIINKHKKRNKKIVFEEVIWLYLMKRK